MSITDEQYPYRYLQNLNSILYTYCQDLNPIPNRYGQYRHCIPYRYPQGYPQDLKIISIDIVKNWSVFLIDLKTIHYRSCQDLTLFLKKSVNI